MRIAVPVAAAGLAAAVAGALLVSSANATPSSSPSLPALRAADSMPSQAVLEKRVAGALAGDDIAGRTAKKVSLSASTTPAHVDPKIIGGTTTTITTAPWMAQLWYYDEAKDIGFFCGGSVVSPTKILTAAHCTKDEYGNKYDWAANGSVVTRTAQLPTENSAGDVDLHGGMVTGVSRQWTHSSYSPSTINNDIAVLTLATPVTAKPILMTTSGDTASYASGTKATLYGWGRTTSTTQDISGTLKTATLPINSDSTCNTAMRSVLGGVDAFIEGHMVCAGTPASGSDTHTTSACNGDSGGPLVVKNAAGVNHIVGVVSWGVEDCVAKGAYSVFSKVSTYVGAAWPRVEDTNLNGDHKADLWIRSSSTKTGYEKDSNGTSFAARRSTGKLDGVNVVLQTDLNRDDYQDLVFRNSTTGDVYWSHVLPSTGATATDKIFTNWKTRTRIIAPGDLTGDGLPDILSVDSAGAMWEYPGKGNGTFSTRVQVSTGWSQYNSVRGHGDFTGDGKADLLARQSSTGDLYLYKGTGKTGSGAFSARIKVRSAWTGYNAFDAVGDITGDGKADFLARSSGSTGTLYLYAGTGKATSEIFSTRKSVGTGFQAYDIFG
ncbi:serine protease [Streptomyces populi]|uniref:Serine protease n=1 Tax=Streptomyces populi TaxID=2058924 RepID=A0A2I0SMT3_9ACTN|nr:serine protease [Streptomyces populi]